jgi:uncharacterized protein YndB with AHSA1/START domain
MPIARRRPVQRESGVEVPMPTESIEVSGVIPASPERVYEAWLDASQHSAMTGSEATVERPEVGAWFTAWDGYIKGQNLELESGRRIVQSWRTMEFPSASADSRLEVLLERAGRGTRVTFRHTEIPEGQGSGYEQGWKDCYLDPMRSYFATRGKAEGRTSRSPVQAKPQTRKARPAAKASKARRTAKATARPKQKGRRP